MLFYNNPRAIQVVHESLIREGQKEQTKRHMLRLIQGAKG